MARTSIDLSGPGALHVVVRLFETDQEFGRKKRALVRIEFECLSKKMACSVSHVAILLS